MSPGSIEMQGGWYLFDDKTEPPFHPGHTLKADDFPSIAIHGVSNKAPRSGELNID